MITIHPLEGVPEIAAGDDLAQLLFAAAHPAPGFEDGDVLVVTQKVVSKAEGRLGNKADKSRLVADASARVLRRSGTMMIAETTHGFVCANAGVDESNVELGRVALLPLDPDLSARRIKKVIEHLSGADIAVIVSDTFGRAWRLGQTDVAIGVAGIRPFKDYIGTKDTQGREMVGTRICIADELASAAEMVMGKAEGICAAIVRGAPVTIGRGAAAEIVRPPEQDFFR
ncbi:MAG: coenzyme F420-0:L-glutamate ligase [Actinomycetota bacterium]